MRKNIILIIFALVLVVTLIWMFVIVKNLEKFSDIELRDYVNTGPDKAYYNGNYSEIGRAHV